MAALIRLAFLVGSLGGCLVGCGDGQTGASFRGDPIFQYSGGLVPAGPEIAGAPHLRIALFYTPTGLNVVDPAQMVEQLAASAPVQVPSSFVFNIFEPPGPEHMLRSADGSDAGFAIARVTVYVDANADGRYTPGEPVVGSEQSKATLYVRDPLPAERTPTSGALPPGFFKVTLPQACGFTLPPPTDPGTCGVPLGGRCRSDADCAGGLCLLQAKETWKAGYCIVPDPPRNGCRPAAAAYLRAQKNAPGPPGVDGYYLRPCTGDADCFRPGDPENNFYTCDVGLRGCTPAPPYYGILSVGGTPPPPTPFCIVP